MESTNQIIVKNSEWILLILIPAIVSIISVALNYITIKFERNKLYADLVAENRIKSDVSKTMRTLIKDVFDANDIEKLKKLLSEVKMCINPYSYSLSKKSKPEEIDYMHDEHIWRLMFDIEKSKGNKKLKLYKEKLGIYISMWLKYDWKRHHYEVQKKDINDIELEYIEKLKEFENQMATGAKK